MSLLNNILRVLADGNYHSGAVLSTQFGVSRARIQQVLAVCPWPLYRVKAKGYRLPYGLELIDQAKLEALLPLATRQQIETIFYPESVTSTNQFLLNQETLPVFSACITEQQTAARPHRVRPWLSPFGENFYVSVCRRFSGGENQLQGLNLAVGCEISQLLQKIMQAAEIETAPTLAPDFKHHYGKLSISQSLFNAHQITTQREIPAFQVKMKWPNELVVDMHRLGRIHIDCVRENVKTWRVIAGVSIDRRLPIHMNNQLDNPCVDLLSLCATPPKRNALIAEIVNTLYNTLQHFPKTKLTPWLETWSTIDALANQNIVVRQGATTATGVARGISPSGELILSTSQGLTHFQGNNREVNIRLKNLQPA